MDSVSSATVSSASRADPATVQGVAALSVLRKSMAQQESAAAQLIAALPQPSLASSGTLGRTVNTYA